jgi:hypothetical protein
VKRVASAYALLGALFASLHFVRLVEPLGVDQGLFVCFARWVPRGWLPYRDLFDSKPPLFLYSYALSAIVPGDPIRALWWLEAAWLAATLALAGLIAARFFGRWAGVAAAGLTFAGFWSPAWDGFWSRAQAEELLALPMLGAAWAAFSSLERARLALWAGVLTGVCGLYKIPSMAIAGAWVLLFVLALPLRESARRLALLFAGLCAPWALACAWFAAHGAFGDLVDGILVYHRHNIAYTAPSWLSVLEDLTHTLLTRATLLVAAAALGIGLMALRSAREVRWLGPWVALTIAAVALQRQLFGYHYMLAVPALALAGGWGVAEVGRTALRGARWRRALSLLALVALALLGAREAAVWWRAYEPDLALVRNRLSRPEYLRRIQLGNYSMATEEQAARYLREHTLPSDGILVWGLSPGIYALADRHPTTRFPFHKLLMTDAPLSRMWPGLPQRRALFMERLRRDPPAYVLVGRGDSNGFEPEPSLSSMMRFAELRAMLERDYRVETEIGHFLAYRRAAPSALTSPPGGPSGPPAASR